MRRIRPPQRSDWECFERLALDESWRVPQSERQLFMNLWAQSAYVLVEAGTFCGIVTAVVHQRSGWIGNLLVPPCLRGNGCGSQLFKVALDALEQQGVETIWLTASEQGRPLYEKLGFHRIDDVERRVYTVQNTGRIPVIPPIQDEASHENILYAHDREVWQEQRLPFLHALLKEGQLFVAENSAALLQKGTDMQIIGPWYSPGHCLQTNQHLLDNILAVASPACELVVDILISSPLRQLFERNDFKACGQTTLMARGNYAQVNFDPLVSFASLGSVG